MRLKQLAPQQDEILRWIGDGCPDGGVQGSGYKVTAYALRDRGLVTVSKRGGGWAAALTDAGRYYVDHGVFLAATRATGPRQRPAPRVPAAADTEVEPKQSISVEQLLEAVEGADGRLVVTDPSAGLRAAYRRSVHAASASSSLPSGMRLVLTGRDHGDLTIRLAEAGGDEPPVHLESVVVPDALPAKPHSVVAELLTSPERLGDVSDATRDRALRLVQGWAEAVESRGHRLLLRAGSAPGLRIAIGVDEFDFVLAEETEIRKVATEEDLAETRFAWQRVTLRPVRVYTGRLRLTLKVGYPEPWWADRKRWSLQARLPGATAVIEEIAERRRAQRAQAERARNERRAIWERAVPQARRAFIDDLNRARLDAQADRQLRWETLGRLCERLAARLAAETDSAAAASLDGWLTFARDERARVDPLGDTADLGFVEPQSIEPRDLDRFMPKGFTAAHPPD